MKVMERIFEDRIRQQIDIDDMQFGFMKGKGKLYFGFVIRWAMCKLVVEEWLLLAVTSMYTRTIAETVVRTVYGNSNGFEVNVVVCTKVQHHILCYL